MLSLLTQAISMHVAVNNHPTQGCQRLLRHNWSRQNARSPKNADLQRLLLFLLVQLDPYLNPLRRGHVHDDLLVSIPCFLPSPRSIQAIYLNTRWRHLFGKHQNIPISGILWVYLIQNVLASSSATQEHTDCMMVWLWAPESS